MRLNKLHLAIISFGLFVGVFIFGNTVVHAQNQAGPPEYCPPYPPCSPFFPAYNFAANGGGTAWNYSVPQDFRYPPVSNEGYDPTGNIETLCNYPKKLLVPNMGAIFPTAFGYQNGPYEYTNYDAQIYVEYWAAAYQCWNSAADNGSASLSGTGLEIDVNGVPAAIELGNFDGASDPDKGGWGGNWHGYGRNIDLSPGDNNVCMKLWGTYNWTQGGVPFSEPFGPLGYGCTTVHYTRAPDSTIFVSKYEPSSMSANGNNFPQVSNAVNDAQVCLKNKYNWPVGGPFACNTNSPSGPNAPNPPVFPGGTGNEYRYNGWRKDGIWYSDTPYYAEVQVPPGYKVTGTNKGAPLCTSPGGTGYCVVRVDVTPGSWQWVDFWFDQIPNVGCTPFDILDPANGNLPFGSSTPEVNQPVILSFTAPNNLPPGSPHFAINSISSSPGGIAGLGSTYGPVNVGQTIFTGNFTSSTANTYTITYTQSWDNAYGPYAGNKVCQGTISFTSKPYVRAYGNNVRAGGSVAVNGTCPGPSNDKATIITYAAGASTSATTEDWKGSGVQYAAYALGEIDRFVSAAQDSPRTSPAPPGNNQARPVLDLTVGNYDPANSIASHGFPNSGLYDSQKVEGYGGVSGMPECVPDYYQKISSNSANNYPAAVMASRTISNAVAEYHDGDLIINGNIDFPATMTDHSVPSYYLVVKGNIYIQPNVSNLSGVFIAQEDPSRPNTGRIYTCGNNGSLFSAASLYGACRVTKLTVNGSFIAKQIKFQRTIDSVKDGSPFESATASHGAEVFNFSPETYIAQPDPSLSTGSKKVKYDYITSLPPIL